MVARALWVMNTPRKKPEDCDHFTVRRILDSWECLDCGLEFVPKKRT